MGCFFSCFLSRPDPDASDWREPLMPRYQLGETLLDYEKGSGRLQEDLGHGGVVDEELRPEITPTKKAFSGVTREVSTTTPPAEKQNSSQKWSCTLCQVNATSEHNLEEHYAGKRHQSNVAARKSRKEATGLKGKATAEHFPGTQQKMSLTKWCCSICQAYCTCESDLEKHLRGRRHQENIQALRKEGKNMVGNGALQEAKLYEKNVTQLAEINQKPPSVWSCSICHAICTSESDLERHIRKWCHTENIEPLHGEGSKITTASMGFLEGRLYGKNASCSVQKKLNGEVRPSRAKKGIAKRESSAANQKIMNKLTPNGSNLQNANMGKMENDKTLHFCWVCNLQCNSEKMLESHLGGKKHEKIVNKQTFIDFQSANLGKTENDKTLHFCWACNLQCNSDKILESHLGGKKHQKIMSKLTLNGSNLQSASLGKMENDKTLHFCCVCNLQCNSEKMLESHLGGKKHRAMLYMDK